MYIYIYIDTYVHACTYIYIYIYIYPGVQTETLDFRGFDSSRILILRGGVIVSIGSIGNFPEVLSQRILDRIICLGRLGVWPGVQTETPKTEISGSQPSPIECRR